ncbi:Cellulose synthase catalytic subunit [UDP-forming] [Gracilariopsis chorda]|uniref:Cellulose synthase catalytic subunit [UDP-forming] n=1 Tax=Gracilariopsis chorda TaxID=448386 RepID=A0A2V3IM64_9FLOR|nr:Cellulose synthase catalytic subunit [UDP-forming] [Gracilariopsis chorda]|eukprot:PXF43171.1 Cellulose synthase catalytic subunit [UDP-forming] [Gracilariopsis chorda]
MPPLQDDKEKLRRQWHAGGGPRAMKPIRPRQPGEWRPGMPCHWMEQTRFVKWRCILSRFLALVQLAAGIAYLQFRFRLTIGIFERSNVLPYRIYQYFFFSLEVITVFAILFRIVEIWNVCRRNCVDFKAIPNHLIAPRFNQSHRVNVRPQFSNYPSVGVFIPCYNEEVDLVLETVLGALNMDYPRELLTVYLCDDGKDPLKRSMISQLRKQYTNVHYVIRPEHTHAKAGNLNYSLERTTTDLVVTLDADFIARPNLLQRLIPYYFIWNPAVGLYEFNETLAVVQTPQHFRNLSPYDNDPLDQRSTFFFELVLPGKDWLNASTMIGTTNLLSRTALEEANYYPYHSITEDTAMSLMFHSLGYRTYYVNESLATGLATTSLWSNLRQRARWLKGDWQILFSGKGPLTARGLSLIQRFLYMHMTVVRFISVVHLVYDVAAVALLVGGIAPLDSPDPILFIIYIGAFFVASTVQRLVVTSGGIGLRKSESGSVAFEAIFRYTTVKGLFIALFWGQNLAFKVTDKSGAKKKRKKKKASGTEVNGGGGDENNKESKKKRAEQFDTNARVTVLGRPAPGRPASGMLNTSDSEAEEEEEGESGNMDSVVVEIESSSPSGGEVSERQRSAYSSDNEYGSSSCVTDDEDGRTYKKKVRARTAEEKAERRRDMRKNVKRIWFNVVMAAALLFAIVWGMIRPPGVGTRTADVLPLTMALGFALANLLPHVLAMYLCFIPYVSGWVMSDVVHGRCDQYAVHPRTGKLFVPWSFIVLLEAAKGVLILGSMAFLLVYSLSRRELRSTFGAHAL